MHNYLVIPLVRLTKLCFFSFQSSPYTLSHIGLQPPPYILHMLNFIVCLQLNHVKIFFSNV